MMGWLKCSSSEGVQGVVERVLQEPSAITFMTSLWKNVVSQALDCNLLRDTWL